MSTNFFFLNSISSGWKFVPAPSSKKKPSDLYFPGNFYTNISQPTRISQTKHSCAMILQLKWKDGGGGGGGGEWAYGCGPKGVILIVCSISKQIHLFRLPNNLKAQSFYDTIYTYCIQISQEKKQLPRNQAARNKRAPVSRTRMRKTLGVSYS